MKFATLVAAATLISTPALAANWVNLGSNQAGDQLAVDLDSVKADATNAAIDTAIAFGTAKSNGVKVMKARMFFSCITSSYDIIEAIEYDAKGNVLNAHQKKSTAELRMTPIQAGTPAEAIGRYACSKIQ